MAKTEWNEKKELEVNGMYSHYDDWYGSPYPPVYKLQQPLTPKENLIRYYTGGEYEWIPDPYADLVEITPHCNPDCDAQDFEGGYDAFGVKWIPAEEEGAMLPSFVEPGFIVLDDINDWRELNWPDVDSWGWKEHAKNFNEALKDDNRMRRGLILSGYFERLISLMSFEEAAVALVAEPEETAAFFEKLTDMNIKIADHFIDDYHCGMIKLHDDWSAQRSPFFSPDTCEEVIYPAVKRLVDHIHAKGCLFVLHSCGNGEKLIPIMKKLKIDGWQLQENALEDYAKVQKKVDNAFVMEPYPDIPFGIHGEELEKFVETTMREKCNGSKCTIMFNEYEEDRIEESRKAIYKVGRKLALEGM